MKVAALVFSMEILTLTAFLPSLVKLGSNVASGVADGAAKQFGELAWKKAVASWDKLRPCLEAKATAQEAIASL